MATASWIRRTSCRGTIATGSTPTGTGWAIGTMRMTMATALRTNSMLFRSMRRKPRTPMAMAWATTPIRTTMATALRTRSTPFLSMRRKPRIPTAMGWATTPMRSRIIPMSRWIPMAMGWATTPTPMTMATESSISEMPFPSTPGKARILTATGLATMLTRSRKIRWKRWTQTAMGSATTLTSFRTIRTNGPTWMATGSAITPMAISMGTAW